MDFNLLQDQQSTLISTENRNLKYDPLPIKTISAVIKGLRPTHRTHFFNLL